LILATTNEEASYFFKDEALRRIIRKIEINLPSEEKLSILTEKYHNLVKKQ